MNIKCGKKIILRRHNWELPGLISLITAILASIYALNNGFNLCIAVSIYLFILLNGLLSIWKQFKASKKIIVTFNKDNWRFDGDKHILEIESDFILFRIETRKD